MISSTKKGHSFESYLVMGLFASIPIHIYLLSNFKIASDFKPKSYTVHLVPELKQLRKVSQMVSPSDKQSEKRPPEETNLLSDKDSFFEKQQLRRGLPQSAPSLGKSASKQQQQELSPTPKKNVSQAKPRAAQASQPLKYLKLNQSALIQKYEQKELESSSKNQAKDKQPQLENYSAFSRPSGSGARFLGLSGNADHIPNLPDGDLTLLNAKASTYAVFVRRVALQVFAELRQSGWESLRAQDIPPNSGYATVRAILSPKGNQIKVILEESSGTRKLDDVLKQAVQSGAKDSNPPEGARAKDGNIHFIFKSKTWVKAQLDPSGRAVFERRWVMLGTGLE